MITGSMFKEYLRLPSLHLLSHKDKCIQCKKCTRVCQMSLNVHEMVEQGSMGNKECILCGECVDICPKGVIRYKFGQISKSKIELHEQQKAL